jgi:hypothetical protein
LLGADSLIDGRETYYVMDDLSNHQYLVDPETHVPNSVDGVFYPDPADSTKGGLGLQIGVRTLAFRPLLFEDVVFYHIRLANVGGIRHDSVYVALYADMGLGKEEGDEIAVFDSSERLLWAYDQDGIGQRPDGTVYTLGAVGLTFFGDSLGLTGYDVATRPFYETDDHFQNDGWIWDRILEAESRIVDGAGESREYADLEPAILITSGPYSLAPGQGASVVAALIFGAGPDDRDLYKNLHFARELYEVSFSLPSLVVNDAPQFTSEPSRLAIEDEEYAYHVQARDTDDDTLRFFVSTPLPAWLSFADSLNGTALLSGIPAQADLGPPLDVSVLVTDGVDSTSQSFSIEYINVNDPPSPPLITAPADSATILIEGEPSDVVTISWTGSVDVDGDAVAYRWDLSTQGDLASIDVFTIAVDTTSLEIPVGELVQIMTAQGVGLNESVVLYHRVVASDGEFEVSSDTLMVNVTRGAVTGTEDEGLPLEFALSQNYPNPFNPSTTIRYALPEPAEVELTVYDVLGRTIRELASGTQPAGTYEVTFDATGLPSGVYFYRLQAGDYVETKRMVVAK